MTDDMMSLRALVKKGANQGASTIEENVALSSTVHQNNPSALTGRGAMSEDATLIDRIYEAAFVPEEWQAVFDELSSKSGSAAGQLLVFSTVWSAPCLHGRT
ncbi:MULTISPECIES: hypothetical protein [unclassified Chelatococcus]|uniref:hypothetical protein n=1 Tax=unclassified Chelatococcus TaxID=2638111 RepID=UPI001BD10D39|nr:MULTISPECIES: hypothetical protein [unclassified Chelatococcus]MBS7696197.1 hypothetical protein [Chelatococcus sp. YT9]MBX3557776.1 hypothetical protein [Chelatococcus sp.]